MSTIDPSRPAEPDRVYKRSLYDEMRDLLNRESVESGSDTPDFVLAQYLLDCLETFNRAVNAREHYYGRRSKELGDGS